MTDTNPFEWVNPFANNAETDILDVNPFANNADNNPAWNVEQNIWNIWWNITDTWVPVEQSTTQDFWGFESWDIRELLKKLGNDNRTYNKLVDKIVNTCIYRKTSLKPSNKIKVEQIEDVRDYKRWIVTVTFNPLSLQYNFKPSTMSDENDFYNTVISVDKDLEKLSKEIYKDNEEETGVRYVLPHISKVLVANSNFVDKNKIWRIWKQHDNTFNIYLGDTLAGEKPDSLKKIHENSNEVVVEASDMAKNIGIWGQPGSGKSVLLRGMMLSAIAKNSNMFNFLVLEKEIDFLNFFRFKNVKFNDAVGNMNIEKIYSLFVYLALEYKRRNVLFQEIWWISNIRAYNKAVSDDKKMPLIILVVDEYKELRDTLKKQSIWKMDLDKEFGNSLAWLLQVSRWTWIFAWLSTQKATDAEGIHKKVKDITNSGIVWHTDEGGQFGSLTYSERKIAKTIKLWDFITFGEIWKNFFRCPFWDANHIEEEEFYDRMPLKDNWQDLTDTDILREYSNNFIVDTIEKIANELKIELFQIKENLYKSYHVDIWWINELRWLRKLAMIVFLNLFLDWFEHSRELMLNTTNIPAEFDLENILTGLKSRSEYKPFSLLFDFLLYLYNINYADFIKSNFKFSAKKKILEEGSEEEKEQVVSFYTQKIMDMMDYSLKNINFGD